MAASDSSVPKINQHTVTYPPEWSDRDRMSYLLAPFPPSDKPLRLDDPKLSFWSSFILSSSRDLHKAVVSERDLKERFIWNGKTNPGCLAVVLEAMEKTGRVMKFSDFFSKEQGWLLWGLNVMKKPVSWALNPYLPASKYEGEYVISDMANVSF